MNYELLAVIPFSWLALLAIFVKHKHQRYWIVTGVVGFAFQIYCLIMYLYF